MSKDPSERPDRAHEKARYDQHRNGDVGHRRFLEPVIHAIKEFVAPGSLGLDWGSGPVPVLQEMLVTEGYEMRIFDPFFGPFEADPGPFDFITLTEVIEHMHSPRRGLLDVGSRLKAGGFLFVQTDFHPGGPLGELREFFNSWGYRGDPTHVSFFSRQTFESLPGWIVHRNEGRLVVLQKGRP